MLSRQNPIRHAAAAVVTNTWFERLILLLVSSLELRPTASLSALLARAWCVRTYCVLQILANCVTLAMYSHQPGFDNTQLGVALGYTEWVFAACFSLELLLKVLAMGLVWQPGTYLRDGEQAVKLKLATTHARAAVQQDVRSDVTTLSCVVPSSNLNWGCVHVCVQAGTCWMQQLLCWVGWTLRCLASSTPSCALCGCCVRSGPSHTYEASRWERSWISNCNLQLVKLFTD